MLKYLQIIKKKKVELFCPAFFIFKKIRTSSSARMKLQSRCQVGNVLHNKEVSYSEGNPDRDFRILTSC